MYSIITQEEPPYVDVLTAYFLCNSPVFPLSSPVFPSSPPVFPSSPPVFPSSSPVCPLSPPVFPLGQPVSECKSAAPSLHHAMYGLDFSPLSTASLPVKPFSCQVCQRGFTRKYDLQRHFRVHTGDKPYKCPCCKKAFARTDALTRHLRIEESCRKSEQVQAMKYAGKRSFRNL